MKFAGSSPIMIKWEEGRGFKLSNREDVTCYNITNNVAESGTVAGKIDGISTLSLTVPHIMCSSEQTIRVEKPASWGCACVHAL